MAEAKEERSPSFGQWLREQRKALDLTQSELAREVGCSQSTIRKIEAGTLRPSRQVAELLAGILQVPTADQAAFVRYARGVASEEWQVRSGNGPETSINLLAPDQHSPLVSPPRPLP